MWCPKCKTEYRDGITVCADCGTTLIEATAEEMEAITVCNVKDEKMAEQFIEYLEYSKVKAFKVYDENEESYEVTVPPEMEKKAEKLFASYMTALEEEKEKAQEEKAAQAVESGEEEEINQEEQDETAGLDSLVGDVPIEENPQDLIYSNDNTYEKKEEEYKDLKFSGITFIVFALAGFAYLVLCKTNVIPISYNLFVFIGIAVMFGIFLLLGINSVYKSGKVKLQIPEEEEKMEEVKAWLAEKITAELVESWKDATVSDAENDLLLMAHIRGELVKQYPDEDVSFLEMLSEEFFNEHLSAEE